MPARHLLRCLLVLPITLLGLTPVSTRAAPPAAGTWTITGTMHHPGAFQEATLLPSGLVLVAGGCQDPCSDTGAEVTLATAEIYHPHTGSWAGTGAMHEPRIQYTSTLLPSGLVLVAGGCRTDTCTSVLAGAELYNPHTGTWMVTGSMHQPRTLHTATLLPDGQVLVAGGTTGCRNGSCSPVLASAELYNPRTGIWTLTGSMHQARGRQTATLLPDGQVLVAGGGAGSVNDGTTDPIAGAELYNPRTGAWTRTGSMHNVRLGHLAMLLPGGRVLVAGGYYGTSAELYHPRTGTWTPTGSMQNPVSYQTGETATLLQSGQVLVAGGFDDSGNPLSSAELYSPRTGTWTSISAMHQLRGAPTITLLPSGQVLVAGGVGNNGMLASAELFHP